MSSRLAVSTAASPAFPRRSALGIALLLGWALAGCGGGSAAANSGGGSGDSGGGSGGDSGGGSGGSTGVVVVVGDGATLPDGATRVAQLTDVPWASLPAGSTVIVSSGEYGGPVTITAQGSATEPIVVRADDDAHPPVLTNSVDFQQAAWVRVQHLVVQSPAYSGFIIRRGSQHITVADSVVRHAPMGVDIADGAGIGHAILRNRIEDSTTNGIGLGVNADPADRTLIQHNTVLRSGHHGMEVQASNYQIEYNEVAQSGQAIGGTSGIHIYSAALGDGTGAGNLVRYNFSHDNADPWLSDGNGIQIDRWCDGNTLAYNVV
jgi:hypothetical protein